MAKVIGLHVKSKEAGGLRLPKLPVDSAQVTADGMEGDYNRHRHESDNDNPDRALLIFPVETMRALNDEGWPVKPGDLGENVTTEGMVNADFDVGVRVRLGGVLAEVAENDMPCKILGQLPYIGEEKRAEFIKTLVGRRGWYARVVEEGTVAVGDQVGIE
jgi:MOSC domain-containing protein YiiM